MSHLKTSHDDDENGKQDHQMPSSHGNNSKSVTPKDVSPGDASHRDLKERNIASEDPEEKVQEQLDDAVEMTFPASDPIAIPAPGKGETQRRSQR